MKNKLLNVFIKLGSLASAIALASVTITSNSACVWYVYQEELPEQAKKLRKF